MPSRPHRTYRTNDQRPGATGPMPTVDGSPQLPPHILTKTRPSETLAHLFEGYRDVVFALFRRRGFKEGECEDLTQETFLKAHRHLSAFRGDAPVENWLFRIASNTAKASLRFRSAARRSADEIPLDRARLTHRDAFSNADDPLRALLTSERSRQLTAAVDRLPARMRCCVQLLLERDIRYREIAHTLRISEQTVKVQILRARGQLRELLSEALESDGSSAETTGARRKVKKNFS